MLHHPRLSTSCFIRGVVASVFGLFIAALPPAHAENCAQVERVVYSPQYGWYPCPTGTAWGCPYNAGVVEFLANHSSPDEACRDLHLVNSTGPGWVLQGGVCASGSGSYVYLPSQMPYCRNPTTNQLSVIDRWGPDPCYYNRCTPAQHVIKLAPRVGSPESGTILTSIEPGKDTSGIIAKVYNQSGQLIQNVGVKLEVIVGENSGGHRHHAGRPKGTLGVGHTRSNVITGNTRSSGLLFGYTAPAIAGNYKIKASCTDRTCTQQGPDTVWVGIKNLLPLPANNNYVLIGENNAHPDNHYMTYPAHIKLMQLADLYRRNFPGDPKLHINDASLERGGLFDIDGNWSYLPKGHKSHRRGTDVDIRANPDIYPKEAIPVRNFQEFEWITVELGGEARPHSEGKPNQHYHVKF